MDKSTQTDQKKQDAQVPVKETGQSDPYTDQGFGENEFTEAVAEFTQQRFNQSGDSDPTSQGNTPQQDSPAPPQQTDQPLGQELPQGFDLFQQDQAPAQPQGQQASPQQSEGDEGFDADFQNMDDQRKMEVVKQLHENWQNAQQQLEQQGQGQQPQTNGQQQPQIPTQQQGDPVAQAIATLAQEKPEIVQRLLNQNQQGNGQQPAQQERITFDDPNDFDPFNIHDPNSKEFKYVAQEMQGQLQQEVRRALQPVQEQMMTTQLRSQAEQYGIPTEKVDDFIQYLQQPQEAIIRNPQRLAMLFKAENGLLNNTNTNQGPPAKGQQGQPSQPQGQQQQQTQANQQQQPVNVDEIIKRINSQPQQRNSPAGSDTNADNPQYANPMDAIMDQMIKASGSGYVP